MLSSLISADDETLRVLCFDNDENLSIIQLSLSEWVKVKI